MKGIAWSLVAGIVVCAFLATSAAQENRAERRVKWEYKVLTQSGLEQAKGLTPLGEEGWELVAVEPELREAVRLQDFKFGGAVTTKRLREQTFYFKRPK